MAYDPVRKVRPVVEPLAAYTAALEEGLDPLEAHARAFGGEVSPSDPDDPAGCYSDLLEAGLRPDRAYEVAFRGGVIRTPPGESISLLPEGLVETEDVMVGSFGSPIPGDGYTSYFYEVFYLYRDDSSRWLWTIARVNVPDVDFSTIQTLGIVLLVEGDLRDETGVTPWDETEETWYRTLSRLAGGKRFDDENPADVDPSLPYRDPAEGAAIITVSFTQPGRGPDTLTAPGDPAYVGNTPDNLTRGRDYWGETTLRAMDAVMVAVQRVVADLTAAYASPPDPRVIVLSTSAGLIAASAWVAKQEWKVHALIDTEGPSDGTEVVGSHNAWDTGDIRLFLDLDDPGSVTIYLPAELLFARWVEWAEESFSGWVAGDGLPQNFPFFYRPPPIVLDDPDIKVPMFDFSMELESTFPDPPGAAWFGDVLSSPSGLTDFVAEMEEFWSAREPYRNLPAVMGSGAAYVRIQGRVNHADQPEWYQCRNAIRNLHAAFEASGGARVYYADQAYVDAVHDEREVGTITAAPTRMSSDLDPDVYDSGVWPEWPAGDAGESTDLLDRYFSVRAWQAQVDLVRWALQSDFP